MLTKLEADKLLRANGFSWQTVEAGIVGSGEAFEYFHNGKPLGIMSYTKERCVTVGPYVTIRFPTATSEAAMAVEFFRTYTDLLK